VTASGHGRNHHQQTRFAAVLVTEGVSDAENKKSCVVSAKVEDQKTQRNHHTARHQGHLGLDLSYGVVFYEEICRKWSFFRLREHFPGAITWL